ncbi:Rho GTPase-activating protein 11A [Anthophora quadrimaculata]
MLIYDVLHKETIYHSVVNDLRGYGVKYRFKKNMFKGEKHEGIKHISKKVFKSPLLYQPLDVVNLSSGAIVHVPIFVSQASSFLEQYITQEGLFRKAGSQLRQKELMARLDNGATLGEKHHAIDVANCLKTFFRDLPEPLIPYIYHDLFVHCAMLKTYRVQALLLACILLPPHHLNTLAFFMEFLKKVSLYEKQNKMNIDNLAKVIGPNIMPLQEATMSAVQLRLELHLIIIKILIENAESIGILPDHITQAISMETIGSTDNELDISDHLHSKLRKKKHRSGSLTRKPHLSASNLNLRMFNGLKKIVGKNAVSEDGNICDNQRIQEKDAHNELYASNIKSTKKRKVEYLDPPSTKKKRVPDKTDKSKKIRLSLDRFVPKKSKAVDEDSESCANTFNTHAEQCWSSVCNACDSQRTYRAYSDGSSQLKFNLKDSEVSNELHKEYNNMFTDADVNLSDDNDEQVLLTKEDNINNTKRNSQLNSEKQNILNNFDQRCLFPSKRKLTVNNFETYSHVEITSLHDDLEEYVTIPKSEYEEIKNRVSAIESRLSQEFGCVNNENEESDDLLPHSVKKVQTAYEKTLEEASIESTVTTDYLAKKLGKELKIRRSGEHKIIRSPSARKIGSLRRRSQERVMSKRVRRTASWHISRGSDLHSHLQSDQELNNAYSQNKKVFPVDYTKDDTYLRPISTSLWEEEKNNAMLNDEFNNANIHRTQLDQNSLQSIKNGARATVRRVSSFHGKEHTNTAMCPDGQIEKLKKANSQNIILNNTCKMIPNSDCWKKSRMSWKDADGYFKSTNHINSPVTQTGRASIAKLRTQNAGMVLAKAKLFDECTTKISTQNAVLNKKNDLLDTNDDLSMINTKQSCGKTELCRKFSKSIKNKNQKIISKQSPSRITIETDDNMPENLNQENTDAYYYIPNESMTPNAIVHQKENMAVKTPPLMKRVPINTLLHESRLGMHKTDNNGLCKTPHIKKPLTVKTPKSAKPLVRKSVIDPRRTPLKAVSQLGTPKYHSPKSILKTPRNISRYT